MLHRRFDRWIASLPIKEYMLKPFRRKPAHRTALLRRIFPTGRWPSLG